MARRYLLLVLIAGGTLLSGQSGPPASGTEAMYRAAGAAAQKKFEHIEQNAASSTPDQTPTVLTENEINAWLSSGEAELPKGVKRLQLRSNPDVINATASVDFDEITAGRQSANPLLSLFRGTHEVEASAHAQGGGGQGQVHIDSVALDGVTVPKMALEYFADKYIKPKYPNLGVDSTFKLPYRIDTATVGSHKVTVTQK
jgi:hypothetical protein